MNTRMKRDKFYFGYYGLSRMPMSEERVRDIAESGIDFMAFHNVRPWLDAFHANGLGVITTWFEPLPHWGGEGYGYVGKMEEKFPLERYIDPAKTFKDHPALWGLGMGDEPNAVDFPYIGAVTEEVLHAYPNQFAYLNLYPSYAAVCTNTEDEVLSQLGTRSYEEYIERYCDYIPNHYISFDFYPYRGRPENREIKCLPEIAEFFRNLNIVADACRRTGRDMWAILQGNHDEGGDYGQPSVFMTIDQVRFQVYAAMAFGVKTIFWWECWVFDDDGNKTEQYPRLQQIHSEVHALAEKYMQFRNVSSHFVGFQDYPYFEKVNVKSKDSLNTGVFFDVKADNGAPLVIGQMVSDTSDAQALMVFAADDPFDLHHKEYTVRFRVAKRTVEAYKGEEKLPVTMLEDGSCSVPICSSAGVLIIAE